MVVLKCHLCTFAHKYQGSLCRHGIPDFPCKFFTVNLAMLLETESSLCRFILSLKDSIFCLITESTELNAGMPTELKAI